MTTLNQFQKHVLYFLGVVYAIEHLVKVIPL